ncbi:uncharacterized protein APUU_60595S [Aspergillus puulaauensis]|uniref:Rhodopsin domain-containing protein n=1 Tax=Aspergillus puulaauensis TaxID=1220207 RepID=A0A7R7XTP9_9EURO|nr:uncharacterized protein APUU_60595S [Aspergillus puulaauensis]BCS27547.1 hypothetical protein APUU_60595S [Aspergillus puulaauensis]
MMESHFHLLLPRGGQKEVYLSARGTQGLVISIIFTILAVFFVLARVYTRAKLIKRVEANDWMIVIALVFSFIFMSFFIVEALNGMGMHRVDIPESILLKQMKAFWITIPFYNAALLCAKASILMQYFRVFPSKRMRHICWIMIALLATYGTWAVLSAFLNCVPVTRFWDPTVAGTCLSSKGLWFSNASMHIATDLAILVIPIPALAALELPKKQKVALISIFALGGFVCVTSVCRLVALKKISDSSDPTYDNVGAASWSAIECNVGIICACLPTLRPLVSRIIPQLLSSLTASRHPRTKSCSRGHIHEIHPQTFWGVAGMGGMGVSTTITTHVDDLEYGSCEGDADRLFAMKYGVGYGRTQARVYVGSDHDADGIEDVGIVKGTNAGDVARGAREVRGGEEEGKDGREGVIVRSHVRVGSSSSSSVPLAGRKSDGEGR